MEPDSKVYRPQRPPSSYGSMRTESDVEEEDMQLPVEEEEKKEGNRRKVAMACPVLSPAARLTSQIHGGTRVQTVRSGSPETVFTSTTLHTKPSGAFVIDTRDHADSEEEMDESLATHSPEPPEHVFSELTQTDENSQPFRLHPLQDLCHTFKCIQDILMQNYKTEEELYKFKWKFCQGERSVTPMHVMEGDILDFVDKIHEILGQDRALQHTINTLEAVGKKEEADRLRTLCQRAWSRLHMKQHLIKKHKVIREGIVRPGKQNLLDAIYVEPRITTCPYGGVEPTHELRPPASFPSAPDSNNLVSLNNLFRLQKGDGRLVRTVLTSGLPGVGLSVCVGKFSLDWAEQRANKDIQVVIQLSFGNLWTLRSKNNLPTMSIVDLVEHFYPECRGINFLDEADCRFLIIMDSFDCYQADLDWKNTPVISDSQTKAHLDVLIVNIIRGTVLGNACVWILGRAAAVSQIPPEFIDAVTEIQGFSDQMKDEYLTKRFHDADLAARIVAHYKRLPTLAVLAHHPFVCWMVASVFERCFMYQDYGTHPPRLTPFYVTILVIQMNRRLQFYHGKGRPENNLVWPAEDRHLLTNMGKMAFKMLQRNSSVFFEEDMKECGLSPREVTVHSGLCTELPAAASGGRRRFCFIHLTFQEFMAALYVFTMFHSQSQNVLDPRRIDRSKDQASLAADLVLCALQWTESQLGRYDMFVRFLCGLFSPECHVTQLSMCLLSCKDLKPRGREKVQEQLERRIQAEVQWQGRDGVANVKECLRELTQTDE